MPAPPITLLGRILSPNENIQRDAVHIAIAPVTADEYLIPGQHVGKRENGRYGMVEEPIGVVDPFLDSHVQEGEVFYLCLYPNTVTSLLHVWTHPAFDETSEPNSTPTSEPLSSARNGAMRRIRDWCSSNSLNYDILMMDIRHYLASGDNPSRGGEHEGLYLPDTFWSDYSIITGESIREDQREDFYFSCSC